MPSLAETFLEAPFAAGGWVHALEELSRQTHSARAQIIGVGGPANIAFNHIANLDDPSHFDGFLEIGAFRPEVNWRVALAGSPFQVVHEGDYRAINRAPQFDIYNDFARKYDMVHGAQTVLASEASGFLGLATLRTRSDGESSAADLELFRDVAPSVLRAIRLQQAIEHQGVELLRGSLDAMRAAAFILAATGQVIAATPTALRLAGTQQVVAVTGSLLRARDRIANGRLQAALGRVLGGEAAAARLWLRRPGEPGSGLVAELYSLPPREWGFGRAPRAVLVLRAPRGMDESAALVLQQALDLSPAEAQVALLLASGLSRSEVAQRRRVSAETVMAQLKSIYRKADVNRESQLVALVLLLTA